MYQFYKLIIILFLSLSLFATNVDAEEKWISFAPKINNKKNLELLYDSNSIKYSSKNTVSVWYKYFSTTSDNITVKSLSEFDCAQKKCREMASVFIIKSPLSDNSTITRYDCNSKSGYLMNKQGEKLTECGKWSSIQSGSIMELLFDPICKGR